MSLYSCTLDFCFNRYEGKFLNGFNTKSFGPTTENDCKLSCLNQRGFDCVSCEFYMPNGHCYLSTESQETKPGSYMSSSNFVYYDRKAICRTGCKFSTAINKPTLTYKNFTSLTDYNCKTACLSEAECL